MSLPELNTNLNHVRALADRPALTPNDLKEVFDQAPNEIKEYINQTLLSAIENAIEEAKTIVQNVLTSDSTINALSAKQGKVLNEKFSNYLPLAGGTVNGNLQCNGTFKCNNSEIQSEYTAQNEIVASPPNMWISDNGWIHKTSYIPAPRSHASYGTEYGAAGNQVYGHVRLIDELGATNHDIPWALHACQGKVLKDMIDTKASKNHASGSTEFGEATSNTYGHVRLMNELNCNNSNIAWALHANQGKVLNDKINDLRSRIEYLTVYCQDLDVRVSALERK